MSTFVVVPIVAAVLIAAGFFGWRLLRTHFVNRYHRETCEPVDLRPELQDGYPEAFHLDDVPWIATREWTCSANSLAMIAGQHGIDATVDHCSFLMGFTYSASAVPGSDTVHFYGDPEAGLKAAAPYLGLERRYYTTDDEAVYLKALRRYLSRGYPLRLGLDLGILYNQQDASPHSEVLVGYDEGGFWYYETVCLPAAPCQPGERPPGEKGLWVSEQTLLAAVRGHGQLLSHPWEYSLTVFEEIPQLEDLGAVWARNGQLLLGGARYGPRQGVDAIEELASAVERSGARLNPSDICSALGAAVCTRRANAAYLRKAYPSRSEVQHAAGEFETAAGQYSSALDALSAGIRDRKQAEKVAEMLRRAATAERTAGELFLRLGG